VRGFPLAASLSLLLVALLPIAPPASAPPPKDWTFLVYMDADNNLEDVGIDDFLEMSSVGSTASVNIVVQFDRSPGFVRSYGDWTTAKRYYVTQGMTPDNASALMDLGEVNMADPATLAAFVNWGIGNYPAARYFLVLWDHGDGWQGVVVDDDPVVGDRLTALELRSALSAIVAASGRRIDILGNDACRMTLEIQYELADFVDYFVGSEKDEPLEGWPYDMFLSALTATPAAAPIDVAATLVDAYVESYENNSLYSVTLSAISAAGLRPLVADLNALLDEVNLAEPYFTREVVEARDATEHYETGGGPGGQEYDLHHFVENLVDRIPSRRLERAAERLYTSFDAAVVHERHWDNPTPVNQVHAANAHGISLWFPNIGGDLGYAQLALSQDSGWDEFLTTYGIGMRPQVALDATAVTADPDGDGLLSEIRLLYGPAVNGTVAVDVYRDGAPVFSRLYAGVGNRTDALTYRFITGGVYEVTVYLIAGGDLQNLTVLPDLVIEERITFRGEVTGRDGNPLDGGTVTLIHLPSGRSSTTAVSGGVYSMTVEYPTWFRDGDPVALELVAGDRRVQVEFDATLTADRAFVRNLFVDTVGMGGWIVTVIALGIVAFLGVAFALYYRQRLNRFTKIP